MVWSRDVSSWCFLREDAVSRETSPMSSPHDEDGRGTGATGPAPVAASGPEPVEPLQAPVAPPGAGGVFGERLEVAERFASLLADTGVSHGLIGPREVPILWERHILNCAVAHGAFPMGAEVVDVGSGAGLPGLALAIVRPDLSLHLVEPMLRRTNWLSASIAGERYAAGGISQLTLLDTQRQALQTGLDRTKAAAQRYADTAALYQALGARP